MDSYYVYLALAVLSVIPQYATAGAISSPAEIVSTTAHETVSTTTNNIVSTTVHEIISTTANEIVSTKADAVVTPAPAECRFGFVACKDGRCEPYESLCGSTGTVTSPKTASTPPVPEFTLIRSTSSTLKPSPLTSTLDATSTSMSAMPEFTIVRSTPSTATESPLTSTQGSSVSSMSAATVSLSSTQCKPGFVTCKDGRCEPDESLCGSIGAFTTTSATISPSESSPQVSSTSMITSTELYTMAGSSSLSSSVPSVLPSATSAVTLSSSPSTGGSGLCLKGWERCKDGTCEPFHWLCVEHGATMVTATSVLPTAMSSSNLSAATVTSTYETATSSTTTPSVLVSTVTPKSSQSPDGSEDCLKGWERCKDGTCEPFHWLCVEHDATHPGQEIIGR